MLPSTNRKTFSLVPKSLDDAMKLSISMSKSNCVPEAYKNKPEDVLVALMMGIEIGLKPFRAVQSIAIIKGRPCIWGDAPIGLVQASGQLEFIKETIEGDINTNAIATCLIKRKGIEGEAIHTFSIEDAKRAGLLNKPGPWQQYPKRMLQLRARAWAIRDKFADILQGLHIAEEVEDYPEEKDITPKNISKTLIEELEQQLQSENRISITEISEKINAAETLDNLNKLTEEIKIGNYSELDKTEIRKVFKEKKESLSKPVSVAESSIRSIKDIVNNPN